MRVQELLYAYLQEQKRLSLPGIGILIFSGFVKESQELEHSGNENAIQFTADRTAVFEESLLLFLKERTGKMKALAQSDFESYISNGVQLLNIGKPFELPGIGVIQKSSGGIISFQQGIAAPELFLTDQTKRLVHNNESETNKKNTYKQASTNTSSKKKIFIFLLVILFVASAAWMVYLQLYGDKKKNNNQSSPISTNTSQDGSINIQLNNVDSANYISDTILSKQVTGFEMVRKEDANLEDIKKAYKLYSGRGHQVRIDSSDPAKPLLLFAFQRPLKDTFLVSDSMNKWYKIRMIYFASLNK